MTPGIQLEERVLINLFVKTRSFILFVRLSRLNGILSIVFFNIFFKV